MAANKKIYWCIFRALMTWRMQATSILIILFVSFISNVQPNMGQQLKNVLPSFAPS